MNKAYHDNETFHPCIKPTESVPSRIKDLIKLVKYWYQEFVPPSQGHDRYQPAILSIEAATVRVWKKYYSPRTINMAIAFTAVMEELRDSYDVVRLDYFDVLELNHLSILEITHFYQLLSLSLKSSLTKQTALDTLRMHMFVNVVVTSNWCRSPINVAPSAVTSRPNVTKPQLRIRDNGNVDKDDNELVCSTLLYR